MAKVHKLSDAYEGLDDVGLGSIGLVVARKRGGDAEILRIKEGGFDVVYAFPSSVSAAESNSVEKERC